MKVHGRQHGHRKTWTIKAMPIEVRRIAVIEGEHGLEPMALFVGRHGLMISAQRWEQVFNDAHARALRIIAEYDLPLEMPRRVRIHDTRHTFAVYMLELLTQLQREKDAEEYARTGRVASYAADHIARNPFLTVMRLLGHRSSGSTMRYLTRKNLWGSFLGYMEGAPGMFLMIGVPSLILLVLISGRMGTSAPDEFRAFAATLLVIPVLVLFLVGTWVMVAIQVVAQIIFAAIIMPVARKEGSF